MFERLSVKGWRQFQQVSIHFHPQLTIITGANGAGKSTLLSLISRHFGYQRPFLSTPSTSKTGVIQYSMGLFSWLRRSQEHENEDQKVIGQVEYSDGAICNIIVPNSKSLSYDVSMSGMKSVTGMHVDSHRPPNLYRHVAQMPTTPMTVDELANAFSNEVRHYYTSGSAQNGTIYHLKNALINMAVFGYGNEATTRNQALVDLYEGFQDKLRTILPKSIGFRKFSVRSPEVVMETDSGDFVMDAASGGVIKIIEIAWQLYSFSINRPTFVATIDEPENHLHPSMQRGFLANLVSAFPTVQFIVVTHSPFIVSSVRDSNVEVLRFEAVPDIAERRFDNNVVAPPMSGLRVRSVKLDTVNKAGTAVEILRDALGVDTTIPDWAETRLQEVVATYRDKGVSQEVLDAMFLQLEEEGLVGEYPKAISELTGS